MTVSSVAEHSPARAETEPSLPGRARVVRRLMRDKVALPAMLVLGGPVRGGAVYGRWPGLRRDQLFEGRDLAVTTDFRALFAEVALRHLGVAPTAPLFPGFTVKTSGFPGVLV